MSQHHINHQHHHQHYRSAASSQQHIFEAPMIKMIYNNFIIQQKDQILSYNLPSTSPFSSSSPSSSPNSSSSSPGSSSHHHHPLTQQPCPTQTFKHRQKYQSQIRQFRNQTTTNGGGYYFYNWMSKDDLLCDLPQGGVRLLAIYIFQCQYEKAELLLQQFQRDITTQMLATLFRGFANIYKLVRNDPQLSQFFLHRKTSIKTSPLLQPLNPKPVLSTISAIEQNSWMGNGLLKFETLEQKKGYIMSNVNYLKKFLHSFPYQEVNQYYLLIFRFISNMEDQVVTGNLGRLLLDCKHIYLLDRLNFAQLLLPLEQRMAFLKQFEHRVLGLSDLANMLVFNWDQDKALSVIITNYLDETGDLQTVATICLQYGHPKLISYIDWYQQLLVLSCQQKKAQALQYQQYKKLGRSCMKRNTPHPQQKLFLSRINFQDEKIEGIGQIQIPPKICYVCYRKSQINQDIFIECGKCKHGGHLQHLLKWYEESGNLCAKPDCACYCV